MKFEDAMNKAFDEMVKKNPQIAEKGLFTPEGLDAAVVVWNMIAIALKEKGLDDIILIGNNNSIISIPISGEKPPKEPKEPKKNKGKEKVKDEKTSSKKPVNGKKEKQTENTDQSAETTDKE